MAYRATDMIVQGNYIRETETKHGEDRRETEEDKPSEK